VYANDETIQALSAELQAEPSPGLRRELDHRIRFMAEEYRAACDGYVLLMEVQADCLDSRVFFTLWEGDIYRRGGADKANDQIDNTLNDRRIARRAAWWDEVRQIAKEGKRYMNTVRTVSEKHAHTAPPGGMSINS